MKTTKQNHGEIIENFHLLNKRLEPFGMHLKASGGLMVTRDDDPHGHVGYELYTNDIEVVEGFAIGLESMKRIHETNLANSAKEESE